MASVQDFTQLVAGLRNKRPEDNGAYRAFLQIKQIFDKLSARIDALESFQEAVTRFLASSGIYVKYFFVQADLEVPMPEEQAGSLFFYIFVMDATGGWSVTFPPGFVGLYADQIDPTADTLSAIAVFKQTPTTLIPAVFGPSGTFTS